MHMLRRIGLLLALAPLAGATDPALVEMVMPDAHVVFGMSFARIRSSPMGELFRTGMQTGMRQATGGAELQNLFMQIGFNPFEDIRELLVASTGAGKNPPTIVAMRGSPRLRQLMESQGMKSKTGADGVVMFGDLLVTGDAAQVKAAKARHGRGSAVSGAMTKRIAEMSGKYDLWVISNVPVSSLLNNAEDAKSPGLANMEMLKSIEQFSAGLSLSSDFALQIEVVAHDAKSAGSLADGVRMMLAMAQQGAAKDPSTLDALKRVDLGVQGKVVRMGIAVPADELRKQMEMIQAQVHATGGAAPAAAPKPRVPANTDIVIQSSPKDMGNIRISGSNK